MKDHGILIVAGTSMVMLETIPLDLMEGMGIPILVLEMKRKQSY